MAISGRTQGRKEGPGNGDIRKDARKKGDIRKDARKKGRTWE
jgi:hypothetical protein